MRSLMLFYPFLFLLFAHMQFGGLLNMRLHLNDGYLSYCRGNGCACPQELTCARCNMEVAGKGSVVTRVPVYPLFFI